MTSITQPAAASGPDSFPFTWANAEHEKFYWSWDQLPPPHPVTPMTASIDARAFTNGIGKAMKALEMPNQTILTEPINGYWFHTALPVSTDPAVMEAQMGRMQAELMKRAPTIQKDWETVLLPEVTRLNQKLRDYPYAEKKGVEIAAFLDEVRIDREQQWELHFLAVIPVMGCAFAFTMAYEAIFGTPTDNEHYRMLQGFPNKSVEAGQALYDIVQEGPPEVRTLLAATPVEDNPGAVSAPA